MLNTKVLVVEDDTGLREALIDTLSLAGYQWLEADSAEQALVLLRDNEVDIVISDVQMDGLGGLVLLRNVKRQWPKIPVLLMTAYGNIDDAVTAMKDGAVDYMMKPCAPEVLCNMISRYAPEKLETDGHTVVADEKSKQLLLLAEKVAKTDANVMILGPSGSGKEVMSRYIHDASPRKDGPFIAINCAAIPDNMLEATLFGYEKGAFTGAVQACPGKFEQAQAGTILLDEISEMDLGLQAKLLRVIQEREVERLGSRKSIQLDVRILATSNRDLKEYVEQGNFREDLYYRLNVFPLSWPPLAERKDDIVPLVKYLIQRHCDKAETNAPNIDESALQKLEAYSWPGNVRELDNVVQRALILSEQQDITAEHILLEGIDWVDANQLQTAIRDGGVSDDKPEKIILNSKNGRDVQVETLGMELREQEFSIILEALVECEGRRKDVSEKLGISPRTLRYKLAKMRDAGINIPN